MNKAYLLTLAIISSSSAFAEKEEHREHGAHGHGHGQLSIIAENKDVFLTIETPALNVFGFEHKPENNEQEEVVHLATDDLESFASLLIMDSNAKCSIVKSEVNQPFEEHEDHKDEHKDDDHKDQDKHAESTHSDVDVEISISCENISELKELDLTPFFKRFPLFLELETQAIINGQQSALVINKEQPIFSLKK